MSKKIALIVAAGKGLRMAHEVPKQFMELGGKPMLMLTIEKFRRICDEITVVLPKEQMLYWKKLCEINHFSIPHHVIEGGETRSQSVANGLASIPTGCLVAIHDGVRPLIDEQIITRSFEEAASSGNAIVSVKLKDTIREVTDGKSKAQQRENYVLVQTPQTFKSDTIKEAYTQLMKEAPDLSQFTDDASVAEYYGVEINLIDGSYRNIKITTPEDLRIAEVLMKSL
jgi:2-C-methyl-D-erythritol 4-phosphate cytidylyltransferase